MAIEYIHVYQIDGSGYFCCCAGALQEESGLADVSGPRHDCRRVGLALTCWSLISDDEISATEAPSDGQIWGSTLASQPCLPRYTIALANQRPLNPLRAF